MAVAWILALAFAEVPQDSSKPGASFQEKSLAVILEDVHPDLKSVVFSPDGKDVSYLGHRQGRLFIFYGNRRGEELPKECHSARICPDGETLIYVEKGVVVVGGKPGPKFDGVLDLQFAPDGKTVAYKGLSGRKQCVVLGETRGEDFDRLMGDLTLSPDGKTVAYMALSAGSATSKGKSRIVVGLEKGEEFDWAHEPSFSPDGKKVAYLAKNGAKSFVVVGGEKKEEFDEVYGPVAFSPDGKRVAYAARTGEEEVIVVGDQKRVQEGRLDNHRIRFSPDGKTVAYAVIGKDPLTDQPKWFVVAGDKKSSGFDLLDGPFFTPDGKVTYAAVAAGRGGADVRQFIMVGDKKWEGPTGMLKSILSEGFQTLHFSRDGKLFAYVIHEEGKQFLVIGQRKGEAFDAVLTNPAFSPEGQKVAFGALKGRELWWKVVDPKSPDVRKDLAKKPPEPQPAPAPAAPDRILVEINSFRSPAGSGGDVLVTKEDTLYLVSWPEGGAAPGVYAKVCPTVAGGQSRLAYQGSKPSVLTIGQGVSCWSWVEGGFQRTGHQVVTPGPGAPVIAMSPSGLRIVVSDESGQRLLEGSTLAVVKKDAKWWGLERPDRSEGPATYFVADESRIVMRVDEKTGKDPEVTLADLDAGTTRTVSIPTPKKWEDLGNRHVRDCQIVSGKVVLTMIYYGNGSGWNWRHAVLDEAGQVVVETPFPNTGPSQMPGWSHSWDREKGRFAFLGAEATPDGTRGSPGELEVWLSLNIAGADGKLLKKEKRVLPTLPGDKVQVFFRRW